MQRQRTDCKDVAAIFAAAVGGNENDGASSHS